MGQARQTRSNIIATILIIAIILSGVILLLVNQRVEDKTVGITYYVMGDAQAQKICADDLAAPDVYPDTEITTIGHRFLTFADHADAAGKPKAKSVGNAQIPQILCEVNGASDLKQVWIDAPQDRATHQLVTVLQGNSAMSSEIIMVFQPKSAVGNIRKARTTKSR